MTSTAEAATYQPARAAKRLRESVAAEHLLAAVRAMHPGAVGLSFVAEWWDGAALVPALLVEVDGRRHRAVAGPTGEITLLPRRSWRARRRMDRLRRSLAGHAVHRSADPRRPHVALTPGGLPRTPLLYQVTSERPKPVRDRPGARLPARVALAVDYRACRHIGCGAIIPLPERGPDPACPRCGRR